MLYPQNFIKFQILLIFPKAFLCSDDTVRLSSVLANNFWLGHLCCQQTWTFWSCTSACSSLTQSHPFFSNILHYYPRVLVVVPSSPMCDPLTFMPFLSVLIFMLLFFECWGFFVLKICSISPFNALKYALHLLNIRPIQSWFEFCSSVRMGISDWLPFFLLHFPWIMITFVNLFPFYLIMCLASPHLLVL